MLNIVQSGLEILAVEEEQLLRSWRARELSKVTVSAIREKETPGPVKS